MSDSATLVIPSEIPWEEFSGSALEELLFWLCDEMGASDLQWRAGSTTGTSRDRGRDLEATFHVADPDGGLRQERWWIQAKGRSATVSPGVVREIAVEVQAHDEVDVLVIATNSRFSNDSRDWITDFASSHPRPRIRLWDRDQLERMVVQHPAVVARVAPQALSREGELRAVASAYWNRQQLPTPGQLDRFWHARDDLRLSPREGLAVIAGDAGGGNLVRHPWAAELDDDLLLQTLGLALANLGPLVLRIERTGSGEEPLVRAVAHLVAGALLRISPEAVVGLLEDPWQWVEDGPALTDEQRTDLQQVLIEPVVRELFDHLGTACMQDCVRMSGELEPESRARPEHRFRELLPTTVQREHVEPDPRLLLIEKQDAPCHAGLSLTAEHGCPFGAVETRPWLELFTELKTILTNRLAQDMAPGP